MVEPESPCVSREQVALVLGAQMHGMVCGEALGPRHRQESFLSLLGQHVQLKTWLSLRD